MREFVFTTEDGVDKFSGDPYVFLNVSSASYGKGIVMVGMDRVPTLKFDKLENAAVAAAQIIINEKAI